MSGVTDDYGLILPAEGEPYDVDIVNANNKQITKEIKRLDSPRTIEFVRVNQTDAPAGTMWGPGNLMATFLDGPVSKNHADWIATSSAGTDGIRLTKEGVYLISWKIVNNHNANITLWHSVSTDGTNGTTINATSQGRSQSLSVFPNDPYFLPAVPVYVPPAGQDYFFKFSSSIANAPLSHRIKIIKVA